MEDADMNSSSSDSKQAAGKAKAGAKSASGKQQPTDVQLVESTEDLEPFSLLVRSNSVLLLFILF